MQSQIVSHLSLTSSLTSEMSAIEGGVEMSKIPYAVVIGSLMHAMVCTRLDIAHALGVVSRFLSNLGKAHWHTIKWILKYLLGITKLCLQVGD